MSLLNESSKSPRPLEAALERGVDVLSRDEKVNFVQYKKNVVPTDGYVFWVATGNQREFSGSLHHAISQTQDYDQTIAINRMTFTSKDEISEFNVIAPDTLWVGQWVVDDVELKVVFNATAAVYRQADIWHYTGDTVYPAMESQLINNASDLPSAPIVSNSLPLWLAQNSFAPVFPSFLVSENQQPPYISVHIDPAKTMPLQQFPVYTWPGNTAGSNLYSLPSSQLMRDTVELTLYGFNNHDAIRYLASIMDYSLNTDDIGFCNSPAIRDEKRKQTEIAAIAMKKSITIDASYYQGTADAVARRLILSAALGGITIN